MHLIHVFHAPLGPSFLVNALLLKERHNKLNRAHRPDSTRNWPTFVSLDDSPKLVRLPLNFETPFHHFLS